MNGPQQVSASSASNSDFIKTVTASCPQGKVIVGTGYTITGGKSGLSPNAETDVVVNEIEAFPFGVSLEAFEEEPTSANWSVTARAICLRA